MADMRQRSIAEDLKNKEMRKAQSMLIYGEQRYEYVVAGQVAAVPFVASIPSM